MTYTPVHTDYENRPRDKDYFAERLKVEMENQGLTAKRLGNRINTSKNTIHQWKNGYAIPNKENFHKLCDGLNVKPKFFQKTIHGGLQEKIENVNKEIDDLEKCPFPIEQNGKKYYWSRQVGEAIDNDKWNYNRKPIHYISTTLVSMKNQDKDYDIINYKDTDWRPKYNKSMESFLLIAEDEIPKLKKKLTKYFGEINLNNKKGDGDVNNMNFDKLIQGIKNKKSEFENISNKKRKLEKETKNLKNKIKCKNKLIDELNDDLEEKQEEVKQLKAEVNKLQEKANLWEKFKDMFQKFVA